MALAHAAGQQMPSFVMSASTVRAGRGYQPAPSAPTLAASARAAAERIRVRVYTAAIETGKDLMEQKEAIGHGNFLNWVRCEFNYSEDTAQGLMRIAREFGSNTEQVRHLTYKALLSLSAKSTPEPIREAVLERAAAGERVTAREIEALKKGSERQSTG